MLYDPIMPVFAKVERFRARGLDVVAAVDLAAEQHDIDACQLGTAHFAWLLDHEPERMEHFG